MIECYHKDTGVKKLAPSLHLPVQSGSNRILQKMARHHQIEYYIEQMDRLKEICPGVGLSTDLIVGFPTETEEDFQATLDLITRVDFDNLYAFAYSIRPGTRAAKMEDDVPRKVKNDRLNKLLALSSQIAERRYADRVGQTFEVLVEGEAKGDSLSQDGKLKVWTARTGCNRVVNFMTDHTQRDLTGMFLNVKIIRATSFSLIAELLVEPTYAEGLTVDYSSLASSEVIA